jgi:ABC-type lipoprotein export system ATPase subunit
MVGRTQSGAQSQAEAGGNGKSDGETRSPYLIELRQVRKVFRNAAGEFTALKDVDLQIGPGEFVAVIGKSGSGKSTLINMITGIDRPTRGEVLVEGKPIHKLSQDALAGWRGHRLGVIFQFFQLLPTLTVLENLMLPMDFCNTYNRRQRKARAMQLLEQVELAEHAHKLPASLSGGQQQRVAIARALANDPPILVADEPTGNLDSKTANAIFHMFEELVRQGKTVVMVTHDRDLADRVSRTVIIADGEIIEEYLAQTFPGLTEQQLLSVSHQLARETFAPGAVIIQEGAPPENFYMIIGGEVEVHLRAPNGEQFVVARMGKGQYIGEIELLRGGNSVATVRASPEKGAEVAALDPSEFAAVMAEAAKAKETLDHVAEDRLAENAVARVGRRP